MIFYSVLQILINNLTNNVKNDIIKCGYLYSKGGSSLAKNMNKNIKTMIIIFILLILPLIFSTNISFALESTSALNTLNTEIKLKKGDSTVNEKTLILKVGDKNKQTITLKTEIILKGTINLNLKWSSSNKKVATVTNNGKVTAIGKGIAIITVKSTNANIKEAKCKITVKQLITNVKLNITKVTMNTETALTLNPKITPSNANLKDIKWISSNNKVATVNSSGRVTAKKAGQAEVIAKARDGSKKQAKCIITVTQPLTNIRLNKTNLTIAKGSTTTLLTIINPQSAIFSNNFTFNWKSSNTKVATVKQGIVKGISEGKAIITVTSQNGKSANCTIFVTKAQEQLNKPLNVKPGFFNSTSNGMRFYFSIPDNPTENMPLIVFLHGSSEASSFAKLGQLPIVQYVKSKEAYKAGKFVFLAPQSSSNTWHKSETQKELLKFIEKYVKYYKIDRKRIILTGMSRGAYGTWRIANNNPNYFAAIVPMSASPNINKSKFVNLPIWAISGTVGDETRIGSKMKNAVNEINKLSGKNLAKFEAISGASHGSVQKSYKRIALFKWMLEQQRK